MFLALKTTFSTKIDKEMSRGGGVVTSLGQSPKNTSVFGSFPYFNNKILLEMEVAPCYKMLSLLSLFTLLKMLDGIIIL